MDDNGHAGTQRLAARLEARALALIARHRTALALQDHASEVFDFSPERSGGPRQDDPAIQRFIGMLERAGMPFRISADRDADPCGSPKAWGCMSLASGITVRPPEHAPGAGWWGAIVLHELGHWTGEQIGRPMGLAISPLFGPSRSYIIEELTAELVSATLLDRLGYLDDALFDRSAYYLASYYTAAPESRADLYAEAVLQAEAAVDFLVARGIVEGHVAQQAA